MIREYQPIDYVKIDEIGRLIKKDFNKVYDIENFTKYEYAKIFVYEIDGCVVGFIQIEIHFENIDIINIAVDYLYQNQGIATKLIDYIIHKFPIETVKLEVKEDNTKAINTYIKNGFIEIYRRKKYYGDKDALIMERKVI